MNGLKIIKKDNFLASLLQETYEMKLKSKFGNLEFIEYKIKKGKPFIFYPSDNDETLEFFYILSGVINYLGEIYSQGDAFCLHQSDETYHFETIEDVTFLYISNESILNDFDFILEKARKVVVEVEKKDIYTKDHSVRVQQLSYEIAKKLGLKDKILRRISFAALFHDIGKIHVSNEILNKPGRLTDDEYDRIKEHPSLGRDELDRLNHGIDTEEYQAIRTIVIQHHERIDGTGYPDGLKGDDILIEAKIIAAADTYDAMTSDRIYRGAMERGAALDELKTLKGKHYDPEVIDALVECVLESGE